MGGLLIIHLIDCLFICFAHRLKAQSVGAMFFFHIRGKQALGILKNLISASGKEDPKAQWAFEYLRTVLENGADAWAMATKGHTAQTVCGKGSMPDFLLLPVNRECDPWTYYRIIDWVNRECNAVIHSI